MPLVRERRTSPMVVSAGFTSRSVIFPPAARKIACSRYIRLFLSTRERRSVRPVQDRRFLAQQAFGERRDDYFVRHAGLFQLLHQPCRDLMLLAGMKVARIEVEVAVLDLVVAHND